MLIQFYIGGQRHYVNTQITQPSRYPRQQLLLGNNLCYYLYFFINYFLPQVTKIREHEIIQGAWDGELLGRDFGLILSSVILPQGVIMDSWRSPMMVCKYSLKEVGGRLFKSRNIIIYTYYLGVLQILVCEAACPTLPFTGNSLWSVCGFLVNCDSTETAWQTSPMT